MVDLLGISNKCIKMSDKNPIKTEFSEIQIKKINGNLLADKYECSPEYVKMVLRGERKSKSEKAKGIIADARAILEIAEPLTESQC